MQQAHVQRQQFNPEQHRRHFTGGDARGQAFDDSGFTHTGFAHHNRVVFAPAGEDVDHLADRVIAAQHRVKFPGPRLLRQIVGKARQ